MLTAVVTFNGRITLPSQVRKDLGLKTGDNVDFVEVEKGRFAIFHRTGSGADQELHIPNLNFAPIPEEADQAIQ
jgi:AbrB family looped-hinge helix DNA binding protein